MGSRLSGTRSSEKPPEGHDFGQAKGGRLRFDALREMRPYGRVQRLLVVEDQRPSQLVGQSFGRPQGQLACQFWQVA